jgi:hypothetical protein
MQYCYSQISFFQKSYQLFLHSEVFNLQWNCFVTESKQHTGKAKTQIFKIIIDIVGK